VIWFFRKNIYITFGVLNRFSFSPHFTHYLPHYPPQFRRQYLHRCHQKPKAVAKVAAARKLAVRLYWMLRTQVAYPEIVRIESSPRVPLVGAS